MISPREQARKEAIIALRNRSPEEYDYTMELGEYGLSIVVDAYAVIPPSGRCRQICETPEEFYGETTLEYRIVRIWDTGSPVSMLMDIGEDLALPSELSEATLDALVLDQLRDTEF